MKIRTFRQVIAFTLASLALDQGAFGGGIGGGAPPSVEAHEHEFKHLQDGALNGDLIRYTEPGHKPVYLRPSEPSITDDSFSAIDLENGNLTVFHKSNDTENAAKSLSLQLAKNLTITSPGILPILSDDLELLPKPKIESVSIMEIGLETLATPED